MRAHGVTAVDRPSGRARGVLVDCGDYDGGNLGDVAMLQVAVRRLTDALPDRAIGVVTRDPEALRVHCPDAVPVPYEGRQLWISRGTLLGRADRVLRRSPLLRDGGIEGSLRRRSPALLEWLVRARLSRNDGGRSAFERFMQALGAADAVVVCGAGGVTDHARAWATSVLMLLEEGMRRGLPTAMFGHGLGPLHDPELRRIAADVLPRLDLLALREGRAGPGLARELGVSQERMVVSGDDAIELAYATAPDALGHAIGVNLRVSRSAGVDEAFIPALREPLHRLAREQGAPLLGLPIGRGRASNDLETIRQLLADASGESDAGATLDTTDRVIARAGRCRIVVTGAYHAAVFALSQGVPTVCLARSAYFTEKMLGLAHQFPRGCTVVELNGSDVELRLDAAIREAWRSAPEVRGTLLDAAESQIAASRSAFARFVELVRDRAHATVARGRGLSGEPRDARLAPSPSGGEA